MKSQLIPHFQAIPLFQDKKYSIEKYINKNTNRESLCVVVDKTFTYWVMIYGPGQIAFDNPYLIAEYIKAKVRKLSFNLN